MLDDGITRTLHADHLRPSIETVNSMGIVFDSDDEFEKLHCYNCNEYFPDNDVSDKVLSHSTT